MPIISFESIPCDKDITHTAEVLVENIAKKTTFPKERIVIKWNFITPAVFFRQGKHVTEFNDPHNELFATVTCSLKNGKENVDQLVQVLVEECAHLLDFPSERITVIVNAKEPGFLYVNNRFI